MLQGAVPWVRPAAIVIAAREYIGDRDFVVPAEPREKIYNRAASAASVDHNLDCMPITKSDPMPSL